MSRSTVYSQHARRALIHARGLASLYQHDGVDTGHLLVGILREPVSLGAQALRELAIDVQRAELELRLLHDVIDPFARPLDWTPALHEVVSRARWEAERQGHPAVGTEHLLLALASSGRGSAVTLIDTQGVSIRQIRQQVERLLTAGNPESVIEETRRITSLSELSRRVMHAARQLAAARDLKAPAPEHLLAAIARERRSPMSRILRQQRMDVIKLAEMLKRERGENAESRAEICEDIIDRAVDHAMRMGAHYTGSDHMLLALAEHPYGASLLRRLNVDPTRVIEAIYQTFGPRSTGG